MASDPRTTKLLEDMVQQLTRIAHALEVSYRRDMYGTSAHRACKACGCTLIPVAFTRCPVCNEEVVLTPSGRPAK